MAHGRLDTNSFSKHPEPSEFDFQDPYSLQLCFKCSCEELLSVSLISIKDLLNIIYIDGNTSTLLDSECVTSANSEVKSGDGQTAEIRTGIRTICVSPDGKHLASGDRNGMLR